MKLKKIFYRIVICFLFATGMNSKNIFAQNISVADEKDYVSFSTVGNQDFIPVYAKDIAEKNIWLPVEVESSSSMFRIKSSEICVFDDETILLKLVLSGKSYTMLFAGKGTQAIESLQENYILPDKNNLSTFLVPITSLNEPFNCAAFSKKKQKWYDRDLCVIASSLPESSLLITPHKRQKVELKNGKYFVTVNLSGGTGRVTVTNPTIVTVKDFFATAHVVFSSSNYDCIKVNGEIFLPTYEDGKSAFDIPVFSIEKSMPVIANTVAMSASHEIRYNLLFDFSTAKKVSEVPIKFIVAILFVLISFVVLFFFFKRNKKK